MTTRILIADDHQVVREGLRLLLEREPTFQVVAEAGDGLEAVAAAEAERPDVVVIDVMMPGLSGVEAIREIRSSVPNTRIVVFSMTKERAVVAEALRNGAKAYVLKNDRLERVTEAIQAVVNHRHYLSPELSEWAIAAYVDSAKAVNLGPYENLTRRERQVLHLSAEGFTSGEIADRLHVSPRTVETHRSNLMRKLDLSTQTDLVKYAIRRGLVSVEPGPKDL